MNICGLPIESSPDYEVGFVAGLMWGTLTPESGSEMTLSGYPVPARSIPLLKALAKEMDRKFTVTSVEGERAGVSFGPSGSA